MDNLPTTQINLLATPMSSDTYALDCETCGVVDISTPQAVNDLAFRHMREVHGVTDVTWGLGPGA